MNLRLGWLLIAVLPLAGQEMTEYQARPLARDGWSGLLGARLRTGPAYPGDSHNVTHLEPLFNAEWRSLYFGASRIGPGFGAGVHAWRKDGLIWDLGLGVGDKRPESRSPALAGMGDRRTTLWAGTGLQWRDPRGWHAGTTLAFGLRDEAGTRATVSAGKGFRLAPQWFMDASLRVSWADAKANAYDFGISEEQARNRAALAAQGFPLAANDLGPYAPGGGLRDGEATLMLGWMPTRRWLGMVGVNAGAYAGVARNSPLVRAGSYASAWAGAAYRF
jgi:outer membrane scaffolding protein for murein synthesis (MipA/OmpV family)